MRISLEIKNIRPISNLKFEIDLNNHGLICISGQNGAGKTTLIKSILNLSLSDTFLKTSSPNLLNKDSEITYHIGESEYLFHYDPAIRSLSTKKIIDESHKKIANVEMPAPHGRRFTFFRTLSEIDGQIRQSVILKKYKRPKDLIRFLSEIYRDNRFENLVEIEIKNSHCCCLLEKNNYYIREDYFSSGEYFLINLYRKIVHKSSLIVIDEIDISLDSSTQRRIAEQLRKLCIEHKKIIIFTSHSLALIQTLEPEEIFYIDKNEENSETSIVPMSFNSIKSMMFGFHGFDRYILTEDEQLSGLLNYVISKFCPPTFFRYQIICLGGQGYINSMLTKNSKYGFLGNNRHIIGIKDGDQSVNRQPQGIYCIPIPNVERFIYETYQQDKFPWKVENGKRYHAKALIKRLIESNTISQEEIYDFICKTLHAEISEFSQKLTKFLCRDVEAAT